LPPAQFLDDDDDDDLVSCLYAQVYALGFSNGGMILQTVLCRSRHLRATLTGVALVNTVLRKAYLEEECADAPANGSSSQQQQQRKVPLVFIHGMQDTLFPFFEGSSSATGDVLLSAGEALRCGRTWCAATAFCVQQYAACRTPGGFFNTPHTGWLTFAPN
jgi:poly(3-hydroxybutyrate) depolymerase